MLTFCLLAYVGTPAENILKSLGFFSLQRCAYFGGFLVKSFARLARGEPSHSQLQPIHAGNLARRAAEDIFYIYCRSDC